MNGFRKLTAVVLAMCLLLGLPMSVSATESGGESEELRLIGAQPILSAMHSNDNVQLMYFNQAIAWNDSATVRVVIADSNNDVVQYNGNTPLYWKTNNGKNSDNVYNGVPSTLNKDHVVTNSAGVTVDTWTEIIDLLANDAELSGKGYRLQIRMYDKGGSSARNGVIDTVVSNADGAVKLSANYVHSNPTSVGLSGDRDCAYIDIGTVEAGATELTPTGMVTLDGVQMIDETSMWLNFSEAVTIDTARTDAVMQVVGGTTGKIIMESAVTLAEGNDKMVRATLQDISWAELKTCREEIAGRTIRLKLTEKNLVEAEGEYAFSYTVDTVHGTESNKLLKSDSYAANEENAERMDYVTAAVEGPQLRLIGAQMVSYDTMQGGVSWGPAWDDKGLILYFNQELLSFAGTNNDATIRVVVVNENNEVVQVGGTYLCWKTANLDKNPQASVNGYMLSLYNGGTGDGLADYSWTSIINLLATHEQLQGKDYRLQVRVYERQSATVGSYTVGNGTVDSLQAKADSSTCLYADMKDNNLDRVGMSGSRDCACIDIGTVEAGATELTPTGVVTLDSVQMIDETSMWLNFSEAVTVDTARTEAKIEVVGTGGTIFMEAPVTLTEGNAKAVKATLTDTTWTQVQAAWSGNQTRTIRLTLTEKNPDAAKAEYANSYTVDTVQGVENEKVLQSNLYAADAKNADRMDFVTAIVEGPQTWKLTQNETVDTLIIPADAKLDLNGYTLTVTALNSYGDITDSTEGEGGLCLSGEAPFLSLHQDNEALPLYDNAEGCYRFLPSKLEVKAVQQIDDNTVKYAIRLELPSAKAYALLDDEENRKNIFIKLALYGQDGVAQETIDYIFRKDIMEEYVSKSSGMTTKYGITLTVSGMENVAAAGLELRATACVDSFGVQRSTVYEG